VLYARFIGAVVDYVLNQQIETMLVTDRDFVTWHHEHAARFVAPNARRRGKTTAAATVDQRRCNNTS
jgi:hypothetical protein